MLWHAIRDLPHSVLVYRGVWDQSGPGFLTRVVRDHGHFRDVVPFHWAIFEQDRRERQGPRRGVRLRAGQARGGGGVSTAATTTSIPRVLHQIWLGKGEMPLNQRRWRRRFAEMNPHWEMRLWTDDNLPPILNRNAWDACGNVGGHARLRDALGHPAAGDPGPLRRVYLDTDVKPPGR